MVRIARPQADTIIFGFDSAWKDNPKSPGAICAIAFDSAGRLAFFSPPQRSSFGEALDRIAELESDFALCLVAIDQPTIVTNLRGSRPVEKVAASVVSFVGGGVQPSSRKMGGMFDSVAPIWKFKRKLKASDFFKTARKAKSGRFLIEVFPALALAALNPMFSVRNGGPKYNPDRRTFRLSDWQAVARTVRDVSGQMRLKDIGEWAESLTRSRAPSKADQDCLDAVICALVALIWRAGSIDSAVAIGDCRSGFMVTPVCAVTRLRLVKAAKKRDLYLG